MAHLIPDIVEYVGATQTLRVTNLKLGGGAATSAMSGLSVTYELFDTAGASLGTGSLAYVAGSVATWEADINVPNRPGEVVRVELNADRGSSHGEWRGQIRVKG